MHELDDLDEIDGGHQHDCLEQIEVFEKYMNLNNNFILTITVLSLTIRDYFKYMP